MTPSAERVEFRNRPGRIIGTTAFVLLTALTAGQALDIEQSAGVRVYWAGLALACAVLACRAYVSNRLRAGPDGILVDTLFRRYRLKWSDIEKFETETRRLVAWTRTSLVVVRKDGTRWDFARELNDRPSQRGGEIDALAATLNGFVVRQ